MARIYIGRSTGIGSFERHVVLKLITPERANDHTAVQMFLDEARLAASLNHQNVAQVFEVGEDGGIHYLAMEYVHGQDLRALLAKAGSQGTRVPLELALTVVAGAAAGLNHAHERRDSNGLLLEAVEAFAVAARMSLSTMALGRFMREMFGETPEPWLQNNRSAPVTPKESTISNTDGSGDRRVTATPTAVAELQPHGAART